MIMRIKANWLIALVILVHTAAAGIACASDTPAAPTQAGHSEGAPAESGGHGDDAHAAKPALLEWDLGSAVWSIVVFIILLVILK